MNKFNKQTCLNVRYNIFDRFIHVHCVSVFYYFTCFDVLTAFTDHVRLLHVFLIKVESWKLKDCVQCYNAHCEHGDEQPTEYSCQMSNSVGTGLTETWVAAQHHSANPSRGATRRTWQQSSAVDASEPVAVAVGTGACSCSSSLLSPLLSSSGSKNAVCAPTEWLTALHVAASATVESGQARLDSFVV